MWLECAVTLELPTCMWWGNCSVVVLRHAVTAPLFSGSSTLVDLLNEFVCFAQVTYTWESLDGWSGIPTGGYTLKNLVLPPPVPAEAGQTYRLRLTARFTGSTAAATADVALTAVGSPLSASLLGPSGDVMGDRDIVLDASKSLDPDDPKVRLLIVACYSF